MTTTLINGVPANCIDVHDRELGCIDGQDRGLGFIDVQDRGLGYIDVQDRGLHYGDGLFETFAVINGEPAMWDGHMQRLQLGCRRLNFPAIDLALLRSEALSLSGDVTQGVLKIIITRGSGGRGYRAPSPLSVQVTRILSLYPWPDYPIAFWSEGVAVRVCATRLGWNPALAGIKHLNRLEQVLARSEWDDVNVPEGLMLDIQGNVIEGTMTNLFVVRNGQLLTPDVSQGGVAGVMRSWILAYARTAGIPSAIAALALEEVISADEIFLCNSVIGLWPVREIMGIPGCSFQVNGPITSDIMAKLRDSAVS